MNCYVLVSEEESDDPIELPIEEDGTLLLTTLVAQYPGACGLKYRNPESNAWRGIRLADGRLFSPEGSWGTHTYVTVYPKEKRKGEVLENPSAKTKRVEKKCSDLIVLGLPWKSTEEDLQKHFSQFGELLLVQVKRDLRTKQSKGFGFVRFSDYDAQVRALSQRHLIEGRWCDIRIPNSQEGYQIEMSQKVYVGRLCEDMTDGDLRSYFSQFGDVTDVFMPRPFRAFAFVTFADSDVAHSLCGDDHIIKGTSVHVSCATPKSAERFNSEYGGGSPGMGGNCGAAVKVGQWQSFNQGGSGTGSGWRGGRGGSQGRGGRGGNQAMIGGAGDFQQAVAGNMFPAGFPQLNPAMVAAAQVALMGLMNSGGMQQQPGVDLNHAQSGAGPYGSPVSGQVQGYSGGWSNAAGGQAGVGGNWNQGKQDQSGWN